MFQNLLQNKPKEGERGNMTKPIKLELQGRNGVHLKLDGEISESVLTNIINNVITPTFNTNNEHTFPENPFNIRFPIGKPVGNSKVGDGGYIKVPAEKPFEVTPMPEKNVPEYNDIVGVPVKRVVPFVEREGQSVYSTESEKGKLLETMNEGQVLKMFEMTGKKNVEVKKEDDKIKVEEKEVPEAERSEDYYRTGIKYKGAGNKPNYRVGYDCPKCGMTGRHYIPPFVKEVPCHQCNAVLEVEPATLNGFGTTDKYRDTHGNFFVANRLVIKD